MDSGAPPVIVSAASWVGSSGRWVSVCACVQDWGAARGWGGWVGGARQAGVLGGGQGHAPVLMLLRGVAVAERVVHMHTYI
jgi:hypothetical protein